MTIEPAFHVVRGSLGRLTIVLRMPHARVQSELSYLSAPQARVSASNGGQGSAGFGANNFIKCEAVGVCGKMDGLQACVRTIFSSSRALGRVVLRCTSVVVCV